MTTGQYWSPAEEGGYFYSDQLSDLLRTTLQPTTKFRQLAEARGPGDNLLHRGDRYRWNIFGDAADAATELDERLPMPETDFAITQSELTIKEAGKAIPYTFKLEAMASQDVVGVIQNVLANNARKFFDAEVFTQFDRTALRVTPTGGNSTTALTLDTDGTASVTNNIALKKAHIRLIENLMAERNIPPYAANDYIAIGRPSAFSAFREELEAVFQYTETGLNMVFEGEKGRFSGIRFVHQTNIPSGGAEDSTTFNPYTNVSDPWNNALSDWIFFMGADTVMEMNVVPEEVRAKIPSDYGRSKGVAWYWLGGYGIVHTDAANSRVIKWDSAT